MKERGDRTGRGTAGARWWRYVPALILVAAATASRWAFGMVTGAPQAPYGPFFIAALLAFRLGGLGPAILAGALGAFSNIAFFHDGQEPFRLGLYFVSTGLAIALFEALHRARGHAEQSAALAAERERLLIDPSRFGQVNPALTEIFWTRPSNIVLKRVEKSLYLLWWFHLYLIGSDIYLIL